MEKISISSLKLCSSNLLSRNIKSEVYKLTADTAFKMFNPKLISLYNNMGTCFEKKVLDAKTLPNIPEITVPNTAVYGEDREFIGYTYNYVKGLSLGNYYANLDPKKRDSLEFYVYLFKKLEDIIVKANLEGFVLPDLANIGNIIVNDDGDFGLIDYDGMQVKDIRSMVIASVLGPEQILNSMPKYSDGNHLYTPQLDKRSIIALYIFSVFNIQLTVIGRKSPYNGEIITLEYLLDYIGLDDVDFMHKIWKIYQPNEQNEFISDDICRIADAYELKTKSHILNDKVCCKCLTKKR